jgi:hypothetical protein
MAPPVRTQLKPLNNVGDSNVFYSRYGDSRTLTKIGENQWKIEGKSHFCRAGSSADGKTLEYMDFEGGPFVCVGDPLRDTGLSEILYIAEVAPNARNEKDGIVSVLVKTSNVKPKQDLPLS